MNYLLSINQKYVLLVSLIVFFSFLIFFFLKYYTTISNNYIEENILISNVDITEPSFSINNKIEKIHITAKEGNFVDEDKILLKKEVKFKSNDFMIESDNVIFDKKNQTASSSHKSIFKSKNTKILSDGFDIKDNGNKINFYGKAKIILK